jgi:hypothetical protein
MKHLKLKQCVGCEEPLPLADAIKIEGLGYVCRLCEEVVPIVFEVEIKQTRAARLLVEKFVASLESPSRESA